MYKEVVMEKEKIAKENERLQAEIQRLRTMASSASTTPSWVEVDKPPSTPKRSTSAVPNYTPGGTRLPMGPPPEDDEVFVFVTPRGESCGSPSRKRMTWVRHGQRGPGMYHNTDGQRMSRKIQKLSSITSKLHTVK